MIIIIFCFFSNTILPTFRYWKIKIPTYSLYKKEAFKSTRNKRIFFFFLILFDFFFFLYTEKVDKMLEVEEEEEEQGDRRAGIPLHLVSVL